MRFLVDPEEVILGLQYNVCIDEFSLLNGADFRARGGEFYVETILLPRQARDEHRKVEEKKEAFSAGGTMFALGSALEGTGPPPEW